LISLARQGRGTLHTKVYPLDAAADALHDLDAGNVRGRSLCPDRRAPSDST
jgi:NAD+-dependent secondary alcohol dehydrogenase Adh1